MAFFKVSCLLVLLAVGVVLSENQDSAVDSAEHDLEGAETVFLGKKLLLLKGLGLGGLLLASQKGGFGGGFPGLGAKFGGSSSVNYAPAYEGYSTGYAVPAPVPVSAPAPVPVPVSAPAPVAYSAPAPAPVVYSAPAPAPVVYSAPAPVADVPISSGYTGNIQVVGYLTPVQAAPAPIPVAYSSQVATGYSYNLPPPPPPAPLAPVPLAPVVPCDH